MSIELVFIDQSVRKVCEQGRVADSLLGPQAARRLRARLADIRAARTLAEVVAGSPNFLEAGLRVLFSLHPPYQLVVEPASNPVPRTKKGEVDWSKIDKVRVIYVGKPK